MANPTTSAPANLLLANLARFDKPKPVAAVPVPAAPPLQMDFKQRVKHPAPLPDGEYNFIIQRVELTQSKTSGNPMLKYQLQVLDAPYTGRQVTKYRAITEKTVELVRVDLRACGLQFDSFVELPGLLAQLQGRCVNGRKKTQANQPDRYNVYFERLVRHPQGEEMQADDLPF